MSINSLNSAIKYSEELDKLFAQKSATGFFADNDFGKKFVGAKTVIVPDIDFQGLANYDRDNGFARGAINVSNTSYTMSMDRARSLQIDREDMDETGIANLAGKILGEYVRTKVVPECDAYVLSKLASIAEGKSHIVAYDSAKPLSTLNELIAKVRNVVGYEEELVAFVNTSIYGTLLNTTELSKMVMPTDFKQGEINLQVKSLNGVALIPVVGERMKNGFIFENGEKGGFKPIENARDVLFLVCPKKVAHLVRKTENMRIFTPEQNIDADAYKFDYRIYYDAFVKKSEMKAIYCSLTTAYVASVSHTDTNISVGREATMSASVQTRSNDVKYKWYIATKPDFEEASLIEGVESSVYRHNFMEAGQYYFFIEYIIDGITCGVSEPLSVEVSE